MKIKEGSDAAIAQFKKVIDTISRIEELDLNKFEKNIEEKVIELVHDLTGKIIKELPEEFIKKIKRTRITIRKYRWKQNNFINENDYKIIESNKNIKDDIKKLCIKPVENLNHGEIELKVGGITIRKTIK